MPNLLLRFDMRNPEFSVPREELYRAALDMAEWADENGFDAIQISEHHGSDDGYLPSPIVLASAMAARTERIRLRFSLILLPFNNPLRLAEDLAVLDILSGGRVEVVLGAGYVPHEFAMFDVYPKDRGRLMEEGVATLKAAWTGEPFQYQGRPALVRPTPLQQPHPPLWLGGSTKAAAKRAARIADYFYTGDKALYEVFRDEKKALGQDPGPWGDLGTGFLVVSDDPEKEWQRLAPYILHECNSYGRWQQEGSMSGQYQEMTDIGPLRESGLYPILSPDEALDYTAERGDNGNVCLHPLVGGLPPAIGWEHLHFFAETVLPELRR